MWFGSIERGLKMLLRVESYIYAPNGNIIATRKRIKIEFRPANYPDWAYPILQERWPSPKGMPSDPINPKIAYGGLETWIAQREYGWEDEDREWVEQKLLNEVGGDFILLEEPALAPPWPGYKKTCGGPRGGFHGKSTPEAIIEMVRRTGCDPIAVLAYEEFAFGESRPDVLAALRGEIDAPVEDEELVSA